MHQAHRSTIEISLYSPAGRRKYLAPSERERFIAACHRQVRREVGTFCLVLAFTGCRISEALSLSSASVEAADAFIALRSLKKRRRITLIRQVPIPAPLVSLLQDVHPCAVPGAKLWSWSRSRAWQLVKAVMREADIGSGPHASPKGLRHGFGVHAVRSGVPLNLVQRWMGHASLTTTAVYLDVLGNEERELAQRMW